MDANRQTIAISMRETNALHYDELRDTIARDWSLYMLKVFPDVNWLFIPNIEEHVSEYLETWNVDGIILTGGESIGVSNHRDKTEQLIFEFAQRKGLPVLGVCRGLQLLYTLFGGNVVESNEEFKKIHIATKHTIRIANEQKEVNSYHGLKLDETSCPASLKPFAYCTEDGSIEGVRGNQILGIMWHPERYEKAPDWENKLIREFFKLRSNE